MYRSLESGRPMACNFTCCPVCGEMADAGLRRRALEAVRRFRVDRPLHCAAHLATSLRHVRADFEFFRSCEERVRARRVWTENVRASLTKLEWAKRGNGSIAAHGHLLLDTTCDARLLRDLRAALRDVSRNRIELTWEESREVADCREAIASYLGKSPVSDWLDAIYAQKRESTEVAPLQWTVRRFRAPGLSASSRRS
jgi:hypothetical protein